MKLKRYILSALLCLVAIITRGQISGMVIDSDTGEGIPFASVLYKSNGLAVVSDANGFYSIDRLEGKEITFSAVGYRTHLMRIKPSTPSKLDIKLKSDVKRLDEVTIKSHKSKYSRKDNPAVELMKRVIAAKKRNNLENKDYYQYRNYEKLTIALNNISQSALDSGLFAKKKWMKDQVEVNPVTGKNVLPVVVTEKIFRKFYRREPSKERIFIDAERSYGINELFETGDLFTVMLQEVFSEVDIYEDQVWLLQQKMISPIGKSAIGFYRFYIMDTLKIDRDSCIQVSFLPNNQQDIGFSGDLYIIKDSTLQVKKVQLRIPSRSGVNFVDNMTINQQYLRLRTGEWVLSVNDMLAEMSLVAGMGSMLVTRTSRRNDYSFVDVEDKMFKGKTTEVRDPYSEMRTSEYWMDNREVGLTSGEAGMDHFLNGIKSIKGYGWLITVLKAAMENYVETTTSGNPSKFDIGPVNSTISNNTIDGLRLRLSGQTTAALNPHVFLSGYASRGMKSGNTYYGTTFTYSFNKKAYSPEEYPKRNIILSSSYDICSPSDKFMSVNKDNVFASFRWSNVDKLAYYHRQSIEFEREVEGGLGMFAGMKFESNKAVGDWMFHPLNEAAPIDGNGRFRTTEAYVQLVYSPGQSYVNSKQRRRPTNLEAPVFKLKHTMGIKGFAGGQYDYQATEASIFKRVWLNGWGKMDCRLKGGVQWSQVPFPLLMAPAANLSYLWMPETFALINNMEFLNDRYASLMLEWNPQGKLFNRVPLLRALQWRELVGFNMLYGGLSDKNNPMLSQNEGNSRLMYIPSGMFMMNSHTPYMEVRLGIMNIFRFFSVEYVRRLTYLDLPTATKQSVRVGFRFSF